MTVKLNKPYPPGKTKIIHAIVDLLGQKDFALITTSEIARVAGVTEGLIYKYFESKRDLLYQVLNEYFENFIDKCEQEVQEQHSPTEKLRTIIHHYIDTFDRSRVYARILLLEVRAFPCYFESPAYAAVRRHSRIIRDIIDDGIKTGEFRGDVSSSAIRDAMYGAIEHAVLPYICLNRKIDVNARVDRVFNILHKGIAP